jgi:hypothetical protein
MRVPIRCHKNHDSDRDGNRSGMRVKRQFRDPVRLSKSHTHPSRSKPSGLKISARPVCGPSFSGSAQLFQTRYGVQFFNSGRAGLTPNP